VSERASDRSIDRVSDQLIEIDLIICKTYPVIFIFFSHLESSSSSPIWGDLLLLIPLGEIFLDFFFSHLERSSSSIPSPIQGALPLLLLLFPFGSSRSIK
jgi:hypothetical protein